jgi:hypothetical protein
MDPMLSMFLSWQFIVFGLAIAAVMFVVRTVVEYFVKNSKMWKDLILPILPVLIGGLSALLISSFPYPNELTSAGSRSVFGFVAGLLSGLMYRIIKSLLHQKLSASKNSENTPAN